MSIQISQQFYNSNADQSWCFERIVRDEDKTLRVEIRRNAYDGQSYVRGYVLDPVQLKWNLLVDRPITSAKCKNATYVKNNESIAPFEDDARSVFNELYKILEIT